MEQYWRQETLEALQRFAYTAWNHPDTLRGSSTSPSVEYLILGQHFAALQDLCGRPFTGNKVLVRQEYRDIAEELDTNHMYQQGAYVIGHAGIGKTYFLVYLLFERLREQKPVAFEPLYGQPYYALFTDGTVSFHPYDDPKPLLSRAKDVWALTDSGPDVITPATVFRRSGVRIIQTTSPHIHSWKQWRCVMNICSEKEIANLAWLLGLDVQAMSALAAKWGGVPRTLLRFYDMSEEAIMKEILAAASSAAENSATLLPSLEKLDVEESGPSLIFFTLPARNSRGHIDRSFPPRVCIPTLSIMNALGKTLQRQSLKVKVAFFHAMEDHPGTRSDGGNIYKRWLHPFFLKGRKIQCQWHVSGPRSIFIPTTVRTTTNRLSPTQGALNTTKPPFYWIAPPVAGIDSVLITKDTIFVIQVTIAFELTSPQDGLDTLRDLLPDKLRMFKWRVLYVGLEENEIRRVSTKWAGNLTVGTEKKRTKVPVGWCAVDPVARNVIYDESVDDERQAMEVNEGCR